jgi:hypothetical protein
VKLTEDEYQLVQVWFGASQWSAVGQGGLSGGPLTSDVSPKAQLGSDSRNFSAENALPPPDHRSDIPLPPDFGFDRELDPELGQKAANQRYGFLKR